MKKIKDHTIDRITRDLLKDFSVQAPENAFVGIRESYEEAQDRRNRTLSFYIAASWLVLIVVGVGFISNNIQFDNLLTADNRPLKESVWGSLLSQNESTSGDVSKNTKVLTVNNVKHTSNKKNYLSKDNIKNTYTANLQKTEQPLNNNNDFASIETKSNNDSSSLSKLDSLKLYYKYITLSNGTIKTDSANKESEILAYNEPLPPLVDQLSKNSWSVIGGVTPMMGFDFNDNGSTNNQLSRLKSDNNNEAPATDDLSVAYSTGISIMKEVSNTWNIRSGITYNTLNENNTQTNYVELPVISELSLLKKKCKIFFSNGIAAGVKASSVHPVGMSGFTFQYPLNSVVGIRLEPSYKHVFGKTWQYKSNYYGVMAGLNISL